MPLLRHGEQRLAEELQPIGVNAEFARARAEEVAFHTHDVADVQQLEQGEILLADRVFLDVDLQALAGLLHVGEPRQLFLRHIAHPHLRQKFLGRFGAVLRKNRRHRVRELVPLAVGAVAQRLDFPDPRQPLFEQVVFEGQIRLLWRNKLL